MNKKFILIFAILIAKVCVIAQIPTVVGPSPNSAGLARYGEVPVSIYNGTANVNVPLLTLEGKELNLPISLSYHTSGIKVNDVAGWVGLGWSLNSGGVITRVMRGKADDGANGFVSEERAGLLNIKYQQFISNGSTDFNGINLAELDLPGYDGSNAKRIFDSVQARAAQRIIDLEPDLYYFNFAGYSGKFVFDPNGNPVLLPNSNLKISPGIGILEGNYWVITTPDGVQYSFGMTSASIETTRIQFSDGSTNQYASSWYLDKITTPLNESIILSYETTNQIVTYSIIESKFEYKGVTDYINTNSSSNSSGTLNEAYPGISTTKSSSQTINTVLDPKIIKQIYSNKGKIVFDYETTRLDFQGVPAISNISSFNHSGTLIKSFKFSYAHFYAGSDYCLCPVGICSYCWRLKLKSIQEINAAEKLPPYFFEYNTSVRVPVMNSYQQDYWGYFNNNDQASLIPGCSYWGVNFSGANREPDETQMKNSVLTKIIYPTGGFTSFQYEANRYIHPTTGLEKIAGGLRIKQISENDGINSNPINIKTYAYEQGGLIAVPAYMEEKLVFDMKYNPYVNVYTFYKYYYIIRSSESLSELGTTNGAIVGYGMVTEDKGDLGKTTYKFSNPISDRDYVCDMYTCNPYSPSVDNFGSPHTSYDHRRGKLLEVRSFNKNGFLIKSVKNTYEYITPVGSTSSVSGARITDGRVIKGGNFMGLVKQWTYNGAINSSWLNIIQPLCNCPGYWQWYTTIPYRSISENVFLTQTRTREYEKQPSGEMLYVEQTTDYQYSNNHLMLTKVSVNNSEGRKMISTYTYPPDYSNTTGFLASMKNKNILKVVENVNYLESPSNPLVMYGAASTEILSGAVSIYNQAGTLLDEEHKLESADPIDQSVFKFSNLSTGQIPPSTGQNFSLDSRYKRKVKYESYDGNGNSVQIKKENDVPTSIMWGNQENYSYTTLPPMYPIVTTPVINNVNTGPNYPIAVAVNASRSQISHTSFEGNVSESDWSYTNYIIPNFNSGLPQLHNFAGTLSVNGIPSCTSAPCLYRVTFTAQGVGNVIVNSNNVAINNVANWKTYTITLTNPTGITINSGSIIIDDISVMRSSGGGNYHYVAYANFEYAEPEWIFNPANVRTITVYPKTGKKYFWGTLYKQGVTGCLEPNGEACLHKLSFWTFGKGNVNIYNDANSTILTKQVIATKDNEWQYQEVFLTSAQAQYVRINSVDKMPSGEVSFVYLDEVRLHPYNSQMTTTTYEPLVGKTSETNAQNITTYYEYDLLKRLKLIRDQDRNITKKYTYHYKY